MTTIPVQGIWKTDDEEKGIFIDAEEESLPEDHVYSDWDLLPDIVLEKVFSMLTMREKYWASLVCRNWYRAFHLPETWAVYSLDDMTLTRRKFNYYSGWQHVLDHWRLMQCLSNVGCHIRYLILQPMMNFYNLYEFMNMLSYYAEQGGRDNYSVEGVGKLIRGLSFHFPCTMRERMEAEKCRIFGTGGQILVSLKRLMTNLPSLIELQLVDLMLDYKDARYLLDDVCYNCCLQMQTLIIVNVTREAYPLIHPGVFLNLNVLVISPQNVGEDLIELVGYTALKHLHIKSNAYSPPTHGWDPIPKRVWQACRKSNPHLQVHLETAKEDIWWQDAAPVSSIIFSSSKIKINADIIFRAIDQYSPTLRFFAHLKLPYFYRGKSFHDRADSSLVLLCRQCENLETLVIRERISTATVLILATTASKLKRLIVRKNAIVIRTDWPQSPEWSDEFYKWLKTNSRAYESVEREVSQIFGYRWTMLSDKEFKVLKVRPYFLPTSV